MNGSDGAHTGPMSMVVSTEAATVPVAAVGISRWRRFFGDHQIEIAVVAFGVTLRLLMLAAFDPEKGYDFPDHWKHLNWYLDHLSAPPSTYTRTAYHAPLFHFVAGLIRRWGVGKDGLQVLSVSMACARLIVLAVGLKMVMPRSPRARAIALLLAGVMPCAIHLDGMVTQEPLNNLLAVVMLVLMVGVFRAAPGRRWLWATMAGVVAGLALLTKVSSVALAATLMAAGPVEFLLAPRARLPRERFARLLPWVVAVLVMSAVGGWWYVRSQKLYGKPFVSAWDLGIDGGLGPQAALPVLDRRSIAYVTLWSADIYADPHYPAGTNPHPRFWPVLVASTFVDYYKYSFARPSLKYAAAFSVVSVVAGTAVAAVTVAGWLALAVTFLRRRAAAMLALLLLPLVGVWGQLAFAIQFPYDWEGVVKGLYMQFSTAPLYPVFGVAVVWLWRRGRGTAGRRLAAASLAAVAGVASYSVYCLI